MIKLVLLRHGESVWNKENRFTGWIDVDLSKKGMIDAKKAGELLNSKGYTFDLAFTSYLRRAIRTLWIVLDEMDLMWIPVLSSWRLNEKHYGVIQGLNKSELASKYGEKQILLWRRSFNVKPPNLDRTDKRYSGNELKYSTLNDKDIPLSESLEDTFKRFLPYWFKEIEPAIKSGKKVLIVAHGNSLRAIIKYIDKLSDEEIIDVNIPTAIPLVYELDENLNPISKYYLGDPKKIKKALNNVINQGKLYL